MPYGLAPAFKPAGQPVTMNATTTPGTGILPPGGDSVRVVNNGTVPVRIAFGSDNTITAVDPVAPTNGTGAGTVAAPTTPVNPVGGTPGNGVMLLGGTVEIFSISSIINWFSAKTATGTAVLEIQRGDGT